MNPFTDIIPLLKAGRWVQRKGWTHGKWLWVDAHPILTDHGIAHIAILKLTDEDRRNPLYWTTQNADVLENDWIVKD